MASSFSLFLFILSVLVLAFFTPSSGAANWCVCKEGLGDASLQKTLDYACGAGAECGPIKQTGACFSPNTVRAHCSYAVNSYFQRKGQAQGSCEFSGTAAVSSSDPSYSGCAFPSSSSAAAVTTTPSTATPTSTPTTVTPITSTTTTNSPFNSTPTGIFGTGVSPTGINTDMSQAGLRLADSPFGLCLLFVISVVVVSLM